MQTVTISRRPTMTMNRSIKCKIIAKYYRTDCVRRILSKHHFVTFCSVSTFYF